MAKALGIIGVVTINSNDYEIESATLKIEQEKINYQPMVAAGPAYEVQVPGGVISAKGTIEFAYDDGNGLPTLGDTLVPVVFNVATGHTVSFDAAVYGIDIKKQSKGLTKVTCEYESSGTITFA